MDPKQSLTISCEPINYENEDNEWANERTVSQSNVQSASGLLCQTNKHGEFLDLMDPLVVAQALDAFVVQTPALQCKRGKRLFLL